MTQQELLDRLEKMRQEALRRANEAQSAGFPAESDAEVYETDVLLVRPGQKARITSPALTRALTGTVERGDRVAVLPIFDAHEQRYFSLRRRRSFLRGLCRTPPGLGEGSGGEQQQRDDEQHRPHCPGAMIVKRDHVVPTF